MIDARSMQCTRGRSLVLWRGRQWSVTNRGLETTDPDTPHIIIAPEQIGQIERAIETDNHPLLPRHASWLDTDDLCFAVARARVIHHRPCM